MRRQFLAVAIVLGAAFACAQTSKKATEPKAPELQIRIMPSKGTYFAGEEISITTEFVNLSDQTLCFPEPPQGWGSCTHGSLDASARLLDSGIEHAVFIRHFMDAWLSRAQKIDDIQRHWIKLAPNAMYTTKAANILKLATPGDWSVTARYQPPESESRRPDGAQSAVDIVGCTAPTLTLRSEAVIIKVIPTPREK